MRKILSFLAITLMFSTLAFAKSFTGKLIDAACYDKDKSATCAPTNATTTFALIVSGKIYKFDSAGNSKAAMALKNRADRTDPAQPQSQEVNASVDGEESGGTITVQKIEVQ